MIRFNKQKITVAMLVLTLTLLLSGCFDGSSSSTVTTGEPLVTGALDLPSRAESDTGAAVSEASSGEPSSATSENPSSAGIQIAPPKTTDDGTPMQLTKEEKAALVEFINRSVAAFASFEAVDEIDEILVTSGMVLCTQEGESHFLDDGTYGVEADVFDRMIWNYFRRRIAYPQVYEEETGEVQYDGDYYRWYGGGFEPGEWTVVGAEDLGNDYIKCTIAGKTENEEGEEVETQGTCILLKTTESPYGYYFIASNCAEVE